jgi:hypothetical protein
MRASSSDSNQHPPTGDPVRPNRAARRGTARKGGSAAAPDHAFGGRARPAQGRRVIPIRRTG